jgi:hypothetical protein
MAPSYLLSKNFIPYYLLQTSTISSEVDVLASGPTKHEVAATLNTVSPAPPTIHESHRGSSLCLIS